MTEDVFFNPGDAIANAHDFAEARRSAEIYKEKNSLQSPLIIAEDPDQEDAFAVYFAKDAHQLPLKSATVLKYHVVDRLDN